MGFISIQHATVLEHYEDVGVHILYDGFQLKTV